jgi:hypothetical protein
VQSVPTVKLAQHLRRKLQLTVELLSLYDLISSAPLSQLSSGISSAGVSANLQLLASALEEAFPTVRECCPLDESELVDARRLVARLLNPEEDRPEIVEYEAALHLRGGAFTLMTNAYDRGRGETSWYRRCIGGGDESTQSWFSGRTCGQE